MESNIRKRVAGLGLYLFMLVLRVKVRLWSIGFQLLHLNRRWFTREVNGNTMLLDFKDKGISRELLYAGIREARATGFLQTLLSPGEVCLDIGSNIGYYALLEARLVGERGKVFCIEPSISNIEVLQKNIEANGYDNIETLRAAAGAENTKGKINLSQSSNRHSFLKADLDFSGETEEVDIVTVDSFLVGKSSPTFIRMDVEGYETEIIRGMKETLAAGKPLKLFIEFHCPLLPDAGRELLETLKKEGFSIRAMLKEHFSMLTVEPGAFIALHDFLFKERYHLLNNSFENYDVSIDEFLSSLHLLSENVFEIFFERK
ncbi:MAG: FkbM family methyltransferase [bacterium]|nr:FkbM family methyltransferase [bacterium]